jgi:F-type H+-transporting ATPase subunit gamma
MQTLESPRRRIEFAQDLQSIVGTMKALAAGSIRHYEQAVGSLAGCGRMAKLGLQAVLSCDTDGQLARSLPAGGALGVVFGSDQGLCGSFHQVIVSHALAVKDLWETLAQTEMGL